MTSQSSSVTLWDLVPPCLTPLIPLPTLEHRRVLLFSPVTFHVLSVPHHPWLEQHSYTHDSALCPYFFHIPNQLGSRFLQGVRWHSPAAGHKQLSLPFHCVAELEAIEQWCTPEQLHPPVLLSNLFTPFCLDTWYLGPRTP